MRPADAGGRSARTGDGVGRAVRPLSNRFLRGVFTRTSRTTDWSTRPRISLRLLGVALEDAKVVVSLARLRIRIFEANRRRARVRPGGVDVLAVLHHVDAQDGVGRVDRGLDGGALPAVAVNSSPGMCPSAVAFVMISSLRGVGPALVAGRRTVRRDPRSAPTPPPNCCASSRDR